MDLSWEIDAFQFDLPVIASGMDGVVSPSTAIAFGRLGAVAALNLEGLWTRYEDPTPLLAEIAEAPDDTVNERLRQIYREPVKPDLIVTGQRSAPGVSRRPPPPPGHPPGSRT